MEIAVIRWLSAEIRTLAFFKNLILLASFLGLAIGFAVVGKGRDYLRNFIPLWGLFCLIVVAMSVFTGGKLSYYPGSADELLWGIQPASFWLSLGIFLVIALIFFLMCVFLFVPLGQATGEEMAKHPPVQAYAVNIVASLLGVWLFSLVSYLHTPPVVWFAIGLTGLSLYYARRKLLNWRAVTIFVLSLVSIAAVGWKAIWSPYNRLVLRELYWPNPQGDSQVKHGYMLNVQQVVYQSAVDLSESNLARLEGVIPEVYYEWFEWASFTQGIPYRLVEPGSSVLIVGSGMGTDVSAALRGNAGPIDAVDIDPAIVDLGRELHPEQPYADARVQVYVGDARSFFNKTSRTYDLVVFGFLDSHTLLSGMSSVRLESFVYTLDSFERVKSLLNPGGHVVVSFATNEWWVEERLGRMMAQVFGEEQTYYYQGLEGLYGTTYVAGPVTPEQRTEAKLTPWQPDPSYDGIPLATDDWPNLYLRDRVVPNGYWQTLLVILLVFLLLVARTFPEALRPDWHFFLLGAAFLLIEFKSVTALALLFGTTWFVNSLAISGVLIMVLFANLYVLRHPEVHIGRAYGLLFASLLLGYLFPLEWLVGLPVVIKALVSMALLSLPMLFAGMIFSESLRRAGETSRPIASNFLGSAAGGLLEYSSLLWGVRSLYVVATGIYLAAMAVVFRRSGGR